MKLDLNEHGQYKWNIIYEYVPNKETAAVIVAEGPYFDFIPDKGELVIINNAVYSVTNKIYDFDNSNIVISLAILRDA